MAEVYRVGIAIVVTSNASQVLGVIGRDIMGLGRQADALSSKLDHVRMAARGAMAAIGGAAVLRGMAVAVNAGKDLVQPQNRMKQVGMSQADIAHATAEAWRETYAVVHRGVTENLALIQGLRKAIGDMGQGIKLSPTASRFEPALASITGNRTEGQGADFFRFLRLRGSLTNRATGKIDIDEAKFWARIGEAVAAVTHGHGTDVTPRDLKMFRLQAAAGSGQDERGPMELAPLIGQMKGGAGSMDSRVGTGLYNLIKQLVMPSSRQTIEALERMKLLDPSKMHVHRNGKSTVDAGATTQQPLLEARSVEWLLNVLTPALQEMGAKTAQEQAPMAGQLTLSSSAARLIQAALRNAHELKLEYGNIHTAPGIDQYHIAKNGSAARIEGFTKAWKDLLTALGSPMVDVTTNLFARLTAGLNTLAQFSAAHPKITADIEMAGAALAGFAVVGGTVAIITSAASALGLFAAGGAAASGLAFLGGAAITGLSAAAGLFVPGAAASAGLLGVTGGLTTLTAVLAGLAAPLAFLLTTKPTTLNTGEQAQLDKLFPNRPRGIAVPAGTPPGIVRAAPPAPVAPPSLAAAPGAMIGAPIHRESDTAPASGGLHVQNIAAVYLDGHAVGQMIFRHAADHATLPPSSGTGYDPAMTPTFTAHLIGNT